MKALSSEKIDFTVKNKGDFVPYRDNPSSFWSGFYTSRISLKGLIRQSSRFLNVMRNYIWLEYISQEIDFDDKRF